jgi:site-specific DNA-methyltransferase (adenine-specific)
MSGEGTLAEVLAGEARWCVVEGDCLDVLPTLPEKSVDAVVTDPPYSRHVHSSVRSSKRTELPDVVEFACRTRCAVDLHFEHLSAQVRRDVARELARLVRRWVAVFSDSESDWLWRLSLRAAGLDYVRTAAWVRTGAPQFTGDRPAVGFETITLAHPKGRKRWNGGGKHGLYFVPIVQNRGGRTPRVHTTQKPLALMLELVEDFTDPDDLILDPFAGSGTTGVAALRLGRRCILIEREPRWAELCRERLRAEESGSTLGARRAGQVPMFGGER